MSTATEVMNDIAPIEIEALADSLSSAERGRLAEELQSIAMTAVWRGRYLESRYGSGCGDQGHRSAVRAANKALIGLRRVLGFTYPERGTINV